MPRWIVYGAESRRLSGGTAMLRIERIELREIRLPLKEPFRISSGVEHERRILLVREPPARSRRWRNLQRSQ